MKPLAFQTNGLWFVRRVLAALFAVSLCLSGITTAPAAVVVTYFQNDATGTPVVATSATGTVLWRETHQPYGVRHTQQAKVASYPLQFTGHAEDPDTGMVYTGARMYDPALARFTGADPAPIEPSNPRSFTRYGYGNNNPYRNVDPDGESPIDIVFLAADTLKLSLAIYSGNAAAIKLAAIDVGASAIGVLDPVPFTGQALKAAVFASKIRAAEKGITEVEKAAKGGTYALKDAEGVVMRTGRSKELARRELEHARDPKLEDFSFEVQHRTDVRSEQRGLEQMLHDQHKPPLDRINPISPRNPRMQSYIDSARSFLDRLRSN